MLVLSRTSVDTEAWSRRYHFQVSQTCLPGAFCCWFGLRGSLWLPLSLPLASDQFFTLNSLLRTRIRSQAAMWVSYRPDQAWVALLLNIASSISCHKLAGVALARCLSRQVKNDPPTADRTAQLAGWAMGVLGRPIPRAPGAGGRYIGLEWAVASRFRPREGGRGRSDRRGWAVKEIRSRSRSQPVVRTADHGFTCMAATTRHKGRCNHA